MKVSRFSVNRPRLTMMVCLIIFIIGGMAFRRLPIDLMPDITYPTLSVYANYENASPEEIEELVTRPIEEAMSAVPGVEEVTSDSEEGSSSVRVSFSWGTDLDAAASDVRDRLDRVIRSLPEDMDRPMLRKFDPSSMPIMIMGASSNLDSIQIRRIIDDQVKYRIERVPGVAALDVWGGLEREIHVNLDVDKVKARGIPLDQVLGSISAAKVTLPAGNVEHGNYQIIVRTPGEYTDLTQIRETVVAEKDGVFVQLKDIADIEDTHQKITRIVRVNGKPGIQLSITKQSGKNTVEVAERVLQEVKNINRDIPQIRLIPIIDSSDYIKRSISSVSSSAIYGGIFAVFVLLFFLRNIRSTAIVAVAIPLSVVATFVLIYFYGFTINIMTLGGLALGIGMLVDNSIVVLENIYRLQESGLKSKQAAIQGSEEVASAVIASTLTTVAIFLPLIFVEGMSGVMFKQLAIVVSFALLCSLLVSLAVIPMLASKYLRHVGIEHFKKDTIFKKLFRTSSRMLAGLENLYRNILQYALVHRARVLIGAAFILILSLLMISFIGVELMPQGDEGEVRVYGDLEVGTRLSLTDEKFKYIDKVVTGEVPEIKSMVTSIGGWSETHEGSIRISLVPQSERSRSSEEIAQELRKRLSGIPGMSIRTRAGTGMFTRMLAGRGGGSERIEIEIRGFDLNIADNLAKQIEDAVKEVEGITDTRISRETGKPEYLVNVNRERAADMKLTVASIARMLQTSIGGSTAGYYREDGNEYRILVRLKDAENLELNDILNLTILNSDGEPVILKNVVDVAMHSGPVEIERRDQERVVTVTANYAERDMGSILGDIKDRLQEIPVPRGFDIGFTGEYEQQQETFGELAVVMVLALLIVYMVMVSLYESFRDPFVVMFSIPPAAIGVVWMLFITGTTFNMQSIIGCIMLAGIVVNNAIVLVDHINLLRVRDKMPLKDAIEEAGRRRLRPILMTAFTTILALTPMATGFGEGGEFQAPLARAVVGGLLSATLITLVVVPVVYYIFERRSKDHSAAAVNGKM